MLFDLTGERIIVERERERESNEVIYEEIEEDFFREFLQMVATNNTENHRRSEPIRPKRNKEGRTPKGSLIPW